MYDEIGNKYNASKIRVGDKTKEPTGSSGYSYSDGADITLPPRLVLRGECRFTNVSSQAGKITLLRLWFRESEFENGFGADFRNVPITK